MLKADLAKEEPVNELERLRQRVAELEMQVDREADKNRYKAVFESVNDIIFLIDKMGIIIDVNERIGGYERKELIGKDIRTLTKITTEKSMLNIIDSYQKRRVGVDVSPYEVELFKKNGELLTFEISARPLKQDGKIIGDLAILRDITERKLTEEALKASEQNFRNSMDNSSMGIRIMGDADYTLYANQALLDIFGYKNIDELRASPPQEHYTPESYAGFVQRKEQFSRGESLPNQLEFDIIRTDGAIRHLQIFSKNVLWDGRQQFQILYNDVTERKEAEQLYHTLVDSSPVGVYIAQDDKFIFANQTIQQRTGYSEKELLKVSPSKLIHTEDQQSARANVVLMLQGKRTEPYEYRIITKTGETKWNLEKLTPITYQGKPAIIGIALDSTESKQAGQMYETLADNSTVGVYIMQNRKLVFTNPAFQQATGFAANELLGIEPAILVHPDDINTVRQSSVKMLKGERLQPYEFRLVTKKGELRWGLERLTSITYQGKRAVLGNFMDVTERKQAQEEIRRSNDTQTAINALLKIALDGLSLEETLKRSIALVLSIPWLIFESRGSIFLVEDDPQVLVMKAQNGLAQPIQTKCKRVPFGRCLCGQAALTREVQFTNALNERHEVRYDGISPHGHYCVPILSADKVLGVLNIYVKEGHQRDKREEVFLNAVAGCLAGVIERKQAEEALKASEEKYSTLIEESSDGIVILKDRLVVFANQMMCEMSGYSPYGILGTSFHELVPPEYREILAERERRDLAKEFVSGREEFEIITKDGKRMRVESRLINIVYKGGPAGMVIIHDITERKENEEKLKQAAQEWRTTFDSITDLVFIHDKDNRIVRVNKAVANMLKTTPKELVGKFCHEMMHGTNEPPDNCPHLQMMKTGKPAFIETFDPNLAKYFYESASPLVNKKGEIIGSVLVARDVTQQKRMEEQLIMTDRLASIGELSSGIAHELNNPLTSVIGFSQMLMEGDVPAHMKEDLATVYSEALRAAAIVKNLLTFARKHAPIKQLSQVNTVVEDVLRLRAYEQKVNNINLENHFAPNLPQIMMDHFQIQQVFLNIIVNAEFAMTEAHNKGNLTITTEKVADFIRVTFTDDGSGISKENLKHIFNPFFTTKDVGKGTGLGLSICHGIVTEHGGKIYARSEKDQGTIFVVELPLLEN